MKLLQFITLAFFIALFKVSNANFNVTLQKQYCRTSLRNYLDYDCYYNKPTMDFCNSNKAYYRRNNCSDYLGKTLEQAFRSHCQYMFDTVWRADCAVDRYKIICGNYETYYKKRRCHNSVEHGHTWDEAIRDRCLDLLETIILTKCDQDADHQTKCNNAEDHFPKKKCSDAKYAGKTIQDALDIKSTCSRIYAAAQFCEDGRRLMCANDYNAYRRDGCDEIIRSETFTLDSGCAGCGDSDENTVPLPQVSRDSCLDMLETIILTRCDQDADHQRKCNEAQDDYRKAKCSDAGLAGKTIKQVHAIKPTCSRIYDAAKFCDDGRRLLCREDYDDYRNAGCHEIIFRERFTLDSKCAGCSGIPEISPL